MQTLRGSEARQNRRRTWLIEPSASTTRAQRSRDKHKATRLKQSTPRPSTSAHEPPSPPEEPQPPSRRELLEHATQELRSSIVLSQARMVEYIRPMLVPLGFDTDNKLHQLAHSNGYDLHLIQQAVERLDSTSRHPDEPPWLPVQSRRTGEFSPQHSSPTPIADQLHRLTGTWIDSHTQSRYVLSLNTSRGRGLDVTTTWTTGRKRFTKSLITIASAARHSAPCIYWGSQR